MALLVVTSESLSLIDDKGATSQIRWGEVECVIGYLKDCWGFDQLRLEFASERSSLVVVEEDTGFAELLQALPTFLPGFPPQSEWFSKVTQPPFNRNVTTLYRKLGLPAA